MVVGVRVVVVGGGGGLPSSGKGVYHFEMFDATSHFRAEIEVVLCSKKAVWAVSRL